MGVVAAATGLAQVETEGFFGDIGHWVTHAADDVANTAVDVVNTTADVVTHPQKYTQEAVEAIAGNSLAQVETENFWHSISHAFDSAADSVANVVETGADVLINSDPAKKAIANTAVDVVNTTANVVSNIPKDVNKVVGELTPGNLAQVQTENFWNDVGDWFGGAAKTVAGGVTGATIALGTEKFWNGLGNGALEATEGAVEAAAAAGI